MVKKILFVLMILLCLSLVSAAMSIDSVTVDPVLGSGEPGASVSFTATVTAGVGSDPIPIVLLTSTDMTFGGSTITAPTINSIINLVDGTSQDMVFTIALPSLPAGIYSGIITAEVDGDPTSAKPCPYDVQINTKTVFTIKETSLKLSGEEAEVVTGSVSVPNTGSTTLTILEGASSITGDITYTESKFIDDDGNSISIDFSDSTIVAPGATGAISVTATIPADMDLGTYSDTITVTEEGIVDTFVLTVRVQPEICTAGQIGDLDIIDLEVESSGEDEDTFNPGDKIKISLTVENEHPDDDKKIIVEAELYDLDKGKKIEDVKSDSKKIDYGEDADFELEIEIPSDDSINEDHEFVVYIKAYESGDEDVQCEEAAEDIEIEREDYALEFKSIVLNPSSMICGNIVDASVTVRNIGSKDVDDATIRLLSTSLGLDETSGVFTVEDVDDEDNEYTIRFTFTVPLGVSITVYDVEAIVTYDDGDERESGFETLTITQCAAAPGQATNVVLEVSDVPDEEIVKTGEKISIPVKLTNNELSSQPYKISIDNTESWAEAIPVQTLTLGEGQTETIYFYLQVQDDVDEGIYTAVVNVKSGNNVIATKTLNFEVGASGIFGGLGEKFKFSNIFYIFGYLVLIVVAIFFIKLIFTGRKGPREVNL